MAVAISVSAVGCKNEPDTDTSAPDEVGGLEIKAADGNAVLTWTNPGDSDFDGIRISLNPAEGTLENAVILEKAAKSFSVSGLETGKTYTFTIQTFDTNRNYSEGTTKEVSVENTKDTVPPGKVQELKAEAQDGGARITWKDPSDEDLFEVEIAYASLEENPSGSTQESGGNQTAEKPKRCSIAPKGAESAYVTGLTNGTKYIFTVTAVDLSGNRSESQSAEAQPEPSQTGVPMTISLEESAVTQNDDGTQTKTVTATIKSVSNIKKVKYDLGSHDHDAEFILDDKNIYYYDDGVQRIFDLEKDDGDNSKYTFKITADPKKYKDNPDKYGWNESWSSIEEWAKSKAENEANGWYTVAAIDDMGRQATASIYVGEFDYTPPYEFNALLKYENKKISVLPYTYNYAYSNLNFYDEKKLKNATISYCKKGTGTAIKTLTFTPDPENPWLIRNAVFTTDELEKDSQYVFTITATDHLEHKRTLTFERSGKKYELGDLILKDGTPASLRTEDGVSYSKYDYDYADNPVIATVAYIENGEVFAITHDLGFKSLVKSNSSTYMYKNAITSIQCTPDKTSASLSESTDITFTGDTDGSDNWSEICKADTTAKENAETNYPGFYYANNLATSDSDYENFPSGWYIPTMAEWHKIFLNSSKTGERNYYNAWTSNQVAEKKYSSDEHEAWIVKIDGDSISFEKERLYSHYLYLIRKFAEE